LGKLNVKDMEKWREQLIKDEYDPQGKIQWGPRLLHNDETAVDSDHESHEDFDDQDAGNDDEVALLREKGRKYGTYRDPDQFTGTIDADALAKTQSLSESKTHQTQVRNMASALLQVEQAIGRRFMKEPFGMNMKRDAKQDNLKLICEARLQQWEVSLMESTSYSQVFLHLNVLNDCIQWRRSTNKSLCKVCRRGTDPEKMLLCDQCNGGTHMFCMKPKMRTVPEGNWYCHTCVRELGLKNANDAKDAKQQKQQKKRKFIVDEVDDDVDEGVDDGDDHNDDDEVADEDEADVSDSEASSTAPSVKINGKAATRRSSRRSNRRLKSKEIEEVVEEEDDDQADESSVEAEDNEDNDDNEEEET